jgi:L-ascorbate metabolism protein UlaG (beta-lactamase superfamily)
MKLDQVCVSDLDAWVRDGDACGEDTLSFTWMGQAGFVMKSAGITFAVDLYLSDSLAQKYRGKRFAHVRMMRSPVDAASIRSCSFLLSSHGHTDHMDGETLLKIYDGEGDRPLFVCPRSQVGKAHERHVPLERMVPLNEGETVAFGDRFLVTALASAHETLAKDQWRNDISLGYIVRIGNFTLYHSGDCIPYDGLVQKVAAYRPDVCFLPVNGRSALLSSQGIAGNFTEHEASELTREVGARFLVPHHIGMFDFNTISTEDLEKGLCADGWTIGVDTLIPTVSVVSILTK